MIPLWNSIFDYNYDAKPDVNYVASLEEEKHPALDMDDKQKLEFLQISPEGFWTRKPTMWNNNPQQICRTFEDWGVTISSMFDSGNLFEVKKTADNCFDLYISSDSKPYVDEIYYKSWFYFSITGVRPSTGITFTIRNMKNMSKLYTAGMRPVFMTQSAEGKVIIPWRRIPSKPTFTWDEDEEIFTLKWTCTVHKSKDDVAYFAYTYPFSFTEITKKIDALQTKMINRKNVYFHRETLTYSREGRKQEIITVSSLDGINEDNEREEYIDGLFPEASGTPEDRPLRFYDKKIVFISSRVHPGEIGASHMFNGFLDLLMDAKNPQSRALLKNFVFKIVPWMNPDGVYRGYYRLDTLGLNLNRFYLDPSPHLHPTTYSVKNVINQLSSYGTLFMYVDFHAHASKKGVFLFGNWLKGERQVENVLFARLMSLNWLNFDMTEWNFSDKNMTQKDKQGDSREGTGRVALYKDTNLIHWYTLELNYHTGKRLSVIPPKFNRISGQGEPETPVTDSTSNIYSNGMWPCYNIEIMEDAGHAFGSSLLDLVEDNPISRIPLSRFKNLSGVRTEVINTLNKTGPVSKIQNYIVSKEVKPPLKVRITKNTNKANTKLTKAGSRSVIKSGTKPALRKATSMPMKPKWKSTKKIKKTKSTISSYIKGKSG